MRKVTAELGSVLSTFAHRESEPARLRRPYFHRQMQFIGVDFSSPPQSAHQARTGKTVTRYASVQQGTETVIQSLGDALVGLATMETTVSSGAQKTLMVQTAKRRVSARMGVNVKAHSAPVPVLLASLEQTAVKHVLLVTMGQTANSIAHVRMVVSAASCLGPVSAPKGSMDEAVNTNVHLERLGTIVNNLVTVKEKVLATQPQENASAHQGRQEPDVTQLGKGEKTLRYLLRNSALHSAGV
ncbi:hypothetical protein ACRRTK_010286 [Alexandromys fortis]